VRYDDPRAVAARERAGRVRWVWAATAEIYPALLRAGVRVARCHDTALTEALLLAAEGRPGEPATLAGAWARLRGSGYRPGQQRPAASGQAALFEAAAPVFPGPEVALDALAAVHAGQVARLAADEHPGRFKLLAAAESAGGLAAAEMSSHGLPWRADTHAALLAELLGPRPVAGQRPARLAALAAAISEGFGGQPVNPDSPGQVLRALAAAGVQVPSTRSRVLRGVEHPAVPLLLEYKELARLHAAHGWAWLDRWVRDGRFRPEYVVGGVVSGRWASRGGGALQIPKLLRRAVVADPGWVLVVGDAAQLELRVLAALSGDQELAAAAGTGDLYQALAGVFGGDRGKAKVALLSAMYGGAGGEAGQLLAVLRRRFSRAAAYVEAAARAGEEGRVVRSVLGRTCPPPSAAWRELAAAAGGPGHPEQPGHPGRPGLAERPEPLAGRSVRARGRFTRNFVVQASAADWAIVMLASLRRRLAEISLPSAGTGPQSTTLPAAGAGPAGPAQLVFFQHDEVVVHCPLPLAQAVVAAIREAGCEAGRLVFGGSPVRFPVTTSVVASYADAK
jgi:hypothetical protein